MLNGLDWIAIVGFFVILVGIALVCSRRAGKDAKDFFLFAIIMVGAVVGMHYAINLPEVGGFAKMMSNPVVRAHLSFFPDPSNADLFVAVFVIPVATCVGLSPIFRHLNNGDASDS